MMLSLRNLHAGYVSREAAVIADVSVNLEKGAFVCVLGRNGAGKSTLMRTVAGLQPALKGDVLLHGENVWTMSAASRARKIAVVLTDRIASPGLRVDDVVTLARQPFTSWQGRLQPQDQEIVDQAFTALGLHGFRIRLFDSLSDGERQRVMIARALAQSPQLVVLDEITAFLDLPGRVEVMGLLRRMARDLNVIVLLSSHDLELALEMADQIWLVDGKGAMHTGNADSIVAQGRVNDAFDTSDVRFSVEAQRFKLTGAP